MESVQAGAVGAEVRPFEIDVPEAELDELRRRIQATAAASEFSPGHRTWSCVVRPAGAG